MSGDREQDAAVRFVAVYFTAGLVAAVLVAVLDWPWPAELALFAVLFAAGLVIWKRRQRHD